MRKAILFSFLATLLLAACATLPAQEQDIPVEDNPDQAPPAQTGTPLPPTDAGQDKPEPVDMPEGAVLVFQRSGGFAGLDEVWTLYADGRLTKADNDQLEASLQEWQVDPEQVTALLEKIDGLGYFNLPASSTSDAAGVDRFAYSLAASYKDTIRMLNAAEGAKGVPEQLWQAITEVQGFLEATAK